MKVSVVIPMYNSENTIVRTLDSVKNQTFKPFEVIIVNDGSKDNSLTVVSEYIQGNIELPIKLIDKKNGGVSSARNAGICEAQGEWIAFLDSDDRWVESKLERQLKFLEENDKIDLLATNRNGEIFTNFLHFSFSQLTYLPAKILLFKNFISPPTVMLRKQIVASVGYFDENQRYAEEGDYWLRICSKNNCYLLNESLAITGEGKPHFGHSGLSSNLKEMEKGELKNIKTAYNLKIINFFEYLLFIQISLLKYLRRLLIVKLRR